MVMVFYSFFSRLHDDINKVYKKLRESYKRQLALTEDCKVALPVLKKQKLYNVETMSKLEQIAIRPNTPPLLAWNEKK